MKSLKGKVKSEKFSMLKSKFLLRGKWGNLHIQLKFLKMKKLFVLLSFSFLFASAEAQTLVSIDSLADHIGETVTVCNKVYGTRFFESSKRQPTFLNIGASYPNSPLTVVVFGEDRAKFKRVPEILYDRKNVCVTGKLETYKQMTEIIVTSPDQIVIQK